MEDDDLPPSQWHLEMNNLPNSTTLLEPPVTTHGAVVASSVLDYDDQESSLALRCAQVTSLVLVTSVGLVSNFLVLLLFYKRPSLRSFSNRFVLNLSISHLLQCVLILPTTIVSLATGAWSLGTTVCLVSGVVSTALNITSVMSLLLIALDRNCAVNSPLHYSMTVTKNRTGFLILLTWISGALLACPPLFGVTHIKYRPNWHLCGMTWESRNPYNIAYSNVMLVIGFFVPFLTTICVYSSMFQAARDNSERARKHSLNSASIDTTVPETQVKVTNTAPKKKYRRWSSGSNQFFGDEWKAVRTGLLVVLTFIFCWLPYFTVLSMEVYFDIDSMVPNYILFLVVFCASTACVINPYLYVFRNKTSRKHVKKLICYSNLSKNKKLVFNKQSKENANQPTPNPCILAASLVDESTEKVKASPALYQDIDGQWQVFSTSEDRREDIDDTTSNISDDDFFDTGIHARALPSCRRKMSLGSNNVQAIYNNSFARNTLCKSISMSSQPGNCNRLLLFRLRAHLNGDSTSSDNTDNFSMSLDSTNSSSDPNHQESSESLPSRRGIGKYLFNTSEELWDAKQGVHFLKRINSMAEDSTGDKRKNISSFGSARRKSFIHSHIKNRKSSETTLTSSTNSETLDSSSGASSHTKSSKSSRPKLVRQQDTSVPPDGYEDI